MLVMYLSEVITPASVAGANVVSIVPLGVLVLLNAISRWSLVLSFHTPSHRPVSGALPVLLANGSVSVPYPSGRPNGQVAPPPPSV